MQNYAIILTVLGLMVILHAISDRVKISSPLILVVAGLAIGFIPSMSSLQILPEIIFLLFLPPLLFDASFNISFKDFQQNFNTISGLAFGLVFLTTAAIAAISYLIIPGMTWTISFVLGATLAATDAVAAISITKSLGLSKRATTILEGESLINDASALVAYSFAVAAVAGVTFDWWEASKSFLILIGGGILVGLAIHFVHTMILRIVSKNHLAFLSLILLVPFITYLLAEELHVSGVIAVVTVGFGVARLSKERFPDDIKQDSKTIWNMVAFLLNGLIFILIGAEFPSAIKSIDQSLWLSYVGYAFLITLVALLIRTFRISIQRKKLQLAAKHQRFEKAESNRSSESLMTLQESVIISWSGMRGIVSLAMAISLPVLMDNGQPFPMRNEILFITTVVVLFTIVGQGLLLPIIIKRLKNRS